jgi:hypothetical protein
LLGHAARKLVACVAVVLGCTAEAVARQAEGTLGSGHLCVRPPPQRRARAGA